MATHCSVNGFPGSSNGKESAHNARDLGLIPGLGRSPGVGHGNPFRYSCLENLHGQRILWTENPIDRGSSSIGSHRDGHTQCTRTPVYMVDTDTPE